MTTQTRDHWADFLEWRAEVDCENLLDIWDLAFGFFSGRGVDHSTAMDLANKARIMSHDGEFDEQERT